MKKIIAFSSIFLAPINVAHAWVYAETSCKQYDGQRTCVPPLPPKPDGPWKYVLWNSYLWGSGIYPYFKDFDSENELISARNSIDTSGSSYGAIGSWLTETCSSQNCDSKGNGTMFTPLGTLGTYDGSVQVGSSSQYTNFFAINQKRQIYAITNGKQYFIQESLNRSRTLLPFRCASTNQEPAYFQDATKSKYPFLCALPPEPNRCEIKNAPIKTSCGNPIDFASGNKFQYETDWESPNSPLNLVRIYNSIPIANGLGENSINPNGWQFKNLGKNLNLVFFEYDENNLNRVIKNDAKVLYEQHANHTFLGDSIIFIERPGQTIQYFYFSAKNSISNISSASKLIFLSDRKGSGLIIEAYPDGSWLYKDESNGIYEVYNAVGQLVKTLYKNGQSLTYNYYNNSEKIPFKVSDQFGKTLNIQSDQNIITSVTQPDGTKIYYGYDQNKALTSVQRPEAGIKRYIYGESSYIAVDTPAELSAQLLTGIVDEKNIRYATYSYDKQGRGLTTEHANNTQKYTVTYNGTTQSVVNTPFNTNQTYTFSHIQGISQPISYYDGLKTVLSSVVYDVNGNLASYYKLGVYYKFTYDLSRNLETSRTEAVGTLQERKTETTWHTNFPKPTEIKESSGGQFLRITTFSYDNNGNVLTKNITDPQTQEARTWLYEYNNFGQLTKETNPQGQISSYQYDETNGNLLKTISADGITTTYSQHNADGQPQHIESSNGQSIDLVYDDAGRIIQQKQTVQQGSLSSNGHSLSWWQVLVNNVYDAFGADAPYTEDNQIPEVTESVATQIATTIYEYDLRGLLIATTLPDGERIEYTYDDAHRLTEIKDQSGNRTVYSLNANGDITQTEVYGTTGQLEAKNQQVYDSLGRLKQTLGNNQQSKTLTYNDYDHVIEDRDATGQALAYSYDVLGRKTKDSAALSQNYSYEYDSFDQIKKVIDAKNGTTTYQYNAFGEKTAQNSPDTGATAYQYQNGFLKEKTDALQLKHQYEYDAQGRVILQKDQKTDGSDSYEQTEFAYGQTANDLSKLTTAKNKRSETYLSYNNLGLVRQKTVKYLTTNQSTAPQLKLNYSYTLGGKLKQLALPSGNVVNYDYNATGQLTGIRLNDQAFIGNIQSNANGVKGWTYSAVGDSVQYVYDLDGRIKQIQMPNVFDKNYSFDAADRILTINDSYQSLLNKSFKHDALSRLTEQTTADKTFKYTYDSNSNRLSRQIVQGTTSNTENYTIATNSNRLSNIQQGVSNKPYSYLATGQITSDGTRNYTYDAQGRSETISRTPNSILNGYDAFGQRIQKFSDNNVQTLFMYDEDGQLLGEYSTDGKVIREYIWLNGTLVGLRSYQYPNEILRVHTDHLGTPRAISNNQNAVIWRWEGDQFGDVLPIGNLTFPIRHAGQYYDQEVGIFYNYFRNYDPITGRYVESDPIGLNGGLNTYGYVGGNALHLTDALGLFPNSAQMACARNPALCAEIGMSIPKPKPIIPPIPLPIPNNPPKEEPCDKDSCPPCTPYPVGTIGYQGPESHKTGQFANQSHYHIFVVNQNPNDCTCRWNNASKKVYGHQYFGLKNLNWINLNSSAKRPPNYPH